MILLNLTSPVVSSSRSSLAPQSSSSSDHASPTAQLAPQPEPQESSTKKLVWPQEELCQQHNSLLRTPKPTLPSQCRSNHLLKRNMSRTNRNKNTRRPRRCRRRRLCLKLSMSHNKLVLRLSCQKRGLSYLRKASQRFHLLKSHLLICNEIRVTKLGLESGL